jgi:hypothetical protein
MKQHQPALSRLTRLRKKKNLKENKKFSLHSPPASPASSPSSPSPSFKHKHLLKARIFIFFTFLLLIRF